MKFYKKDIPGVYLPGTIWNPATGRRWCSFDAGGGTVETEDKELIEVLMGFGYPHEGEVPVDEIDTTEIDEEKGDPESEKTGGEEDSEPLEDGLKDFTLKDSQTTTEAQSPRYKDMTEFNKLIKGMNKLELEVFAREQFGVELDKRYNWMRLQKQVRELGERALEE